MKILRTASIASLLVALSATGASPAIAATSGSPDRTAAAVNVSLPHTAFAALAYGTRVTGAVAGGGVTSGTTAMSSFSCSTNAGKTRRNSIASVNNGALTAGAISTKAQSIGTSTHRTARATTSVAGVNILSGLITASAVTTTSTSTVTSTGVTYGNNRSTLTGLTVAGKAISAGVSPNTRISLSVGGAVIGRVVINEQTKTIVGGYKHTITRALDVHITAKNPLGLKVGARIIVGNSSATLSAVPAGFAGGHGFATRASTLSGTAKSGATALAAVPCTGGSREANVAGASLPGGLLSVGAATTTTKAVTNPSLSSHAVNSIASVGVLANLISASGVVADTTTTRKTKWSKAHFSDTSTFGTLSVAGQPAIDANVAPNTTINLLGLGKVTFHKKEVTKTGIRVTMIYVVLGQALGGLPTGTVIEIGVSDTSVR